MCMFSPIFFFSFNRLLSADQINISPIRSVVFSSMILPLFEMKFVIKALVLEAHHH